MTGIEVLDYIEDIIEAARKVETYTHGMTYETFEDDSRTVDAVLRNFEVIGEAAKNVPEQVRGEYENVPWSEMAGMRDKLIHGYATIDLRIVWITIEEDIPALADQLEAVKADIEDDG